MDATATMGVNASVGGAGATILRLKIDRFRAFQKFDWFPKAGLNVILGGGDAGKTTILEAIALLLNPSNAALVSDNDYWRRQRKEGFFIGAVIGLPPDSSIATQSRPAFPWEWDGRQACKPQESDEGEPARPVWPPVYKVSVSGSEELDLTYAIHNPNDTTDIFSPTLRREIGLVRLGGDDRNDRDLRLVQGSALDRLLSDKALRSRLTETIRNRIVDTMRIVPLSALERWSAARLATLISEDGRWINEASTFTLNRLIGGLAAGFCLLLASAFFDLATALATFASFGAGLATYPLAGRILTPPIAARNAQITALKAEALDEIIQENADRAKGVVRGPERALTFRQRLGAMLRKVAGHRV